MQVYLIWKGFFNYQGSFGLRGIVNFPLFKAKNQTIAICEIYIGT